MADILAGMVAEEFRLSTDLLAAILSVTALARTMAELSACMKSALKLLSTSLPTMGKLKMAWLVGERLFSTSASLFSQIGARRTLNIVRMTLVVNRGMPTSWMSSTL